MSNVLEGKRPHILSKTCVGHCNLWLVSRRFHPKNLIKYVQTTENADNGITIIYRLVSVGKEDAYYRIEVSYHCKHHRRIIPSELAAAATESRNYPKNKGDHGHYASNNTGDRHSPGSVPDGSAACCLGHILGS